MASSRFTAIFVENKKTIRAYSDLAFQVLEIFDEAVELSIWLPQEMKNESRCLA